MGRSRTASEGPSPGPLLRCVWLAGQTQPSPSTPWHVQPKSLCPVGTASRPPASHSPPRLVLESAITSRWKDREHHPALRAAFKFCGEKKKKPSRKSNLKSRAGNGWCVCVCVLGGYCTHAGCVPETRRWRLGWEGVHGSRLLTAAARGWPPPTGLRCLEPWGSGVRLAPRLGVRGSRAGGGAQVLLLIHKDERPRPAH